MLFESLALNLMPFMALFKVWLLLGTNRLPVFLSEKAPLNIPFIIGAQSVE
jgi:hypothetical protein